MQVPLLRVSGRFLRQPVRHNALRQFSSTPVAFARRKKIEHDPITPDDADEILDDTYENDDTTSGGHMVLREQRQNLYYMRVIEHEMPKLVGMYNQLAFRE